MTPPRECPGCYNNTCLPLVVTAVTVTVRAINLRCRLFRVPHLMFPLSFGEEVAHRVTMRIVVP